MRNIIMKNGDTQKNKERSTFLVHVSNCALKVIRNLDSTPDAVAHRCVLGESHLMLFHTLEPNSLPVVVAQPDERHANTTASVLE